MYETALHVRQTLETSYLEAFYHAHCVRSVFASSSACQTAGFFVGRIAAHWRRYTMRKNTPTPLDELIARLEAMAERYRRQARQQTQDTATEEAVDAIEADILYDRLSCAQSLRAGCLPETGALNNVRPGTEEARYAAFN